MGLRIGLVTGEYPPMEGGVGAFTQEIARALALQDHDVHILAGRDAKPPLDSGVVRVAGEPIPLGFAKLSPIIGRWRWPSLAVAASWVERYDLDVVNVQYQPAAFNMKSGMANMLPWRLRGLAPTAVTFHDLRTPYLFPKAGPLRQTAVRQMAKMAAGVIATNAADYQTLQQWGLPPEQLVQIPIGSNIAVHDVGAADMAAVRRELGVAPDVLLLGYFGFLNESKGADVLLAALAGLPETVHLVFIGGRTGSSDEANNAAFFQKLDAQIAALNLQQRVHWTGFVPEHHVSAYLMSMTLMVMPYRDGVSLRRGTLMAALVHERPLITTHPTIPTPELVHGQNVWLVPPDDVVALQTAVQHLLAEPELRQRLGAGAGQIASLFSWDKIAAQTADFLQTLIVMRDA